MNFDNANTEVTRKSFGSKVDKTFQREGVVPLKDRKKDKVDLAQESAKYNELNKNVENRRLNDAKDKRAFDTAISKGYEDVREKIADSINQKYSTRFEQNNIIMTVGAAGGLNVILKSIIKEYNKYL